MQWDVPPECETASGHFSLRSQPPSLHSRGQGMTSGEVITGHYDPRLVALSVLIGVIGGYCTIELAERVTSTRHRERIYWWIGGAITMAIGTWSMHYTGMLALRLPVPVLYDWPTAFLCYLGSLFTS